MAFVIGKAEKKSVFQLSQNQQIVPGPGAYSKDMKDFRQYCAPFNTSDAKISTFEPEETKYGPGSYEPKYFKDINKVNSNKGYVFASKVQRFANSSSDDKKKLEKIKIQNGILLSSRSKTQHKNQTNYTFSPNKNAAEQTYQQRLERSKSVMQEVRLQNHAKKVQSIKGKRDFIRVLLTSSKNTENVESRYIFRNTNGKTLGPGSYQNCDFQPKSKGVAKWMLDKNIRFKTQKSVAPGPGTYLNDNISETDERFQNQMLTKSKKRLSAAFASTVIRSHMDSIIYRTNIPIKAAILQDKRLKDNRPGPGSYNVVAANKDKKSFNYSFQTSFGISQRKTLQTGELQPGPGAYQLQEGDINIRTNIKTKENKIIKEIRNQIFGKKGKIASNDNKNNSLTRSYINKGNGIDPHFGDKTHRERKQKKVQKFCSLEQRCFSKLGNMNQEERFKKKQNKTEAQLGPGHYYNQKLDTGFSVGQWQKVTSSIFKSGTNRTVFQNSNEKNQSELPFYNIVRNDIGFKAEKMKKYIQNLKKINIQKSPFQTSSKRFIEKDDSDLNFIIFQFDDAHRKVISEQKEKKPSSTFKSGTKREIFKSQQMPGPGDYNLKMKFNGAQDSLEKKSFNKNYGLLKGYYEENNIKLEPRQQSIFSRKNSKKRASKSQMKKVDVNQTKKLSKDQMHIVSGKI